MGCVSKRGPCLVEASAFVLDPIYGSNILVPHPLLAVDGDLIDQGLLVSLLVHIEGCLAILGPLADRDRSWAERS